MKLKFCESCLNVTLANRYYMPLWVFVLKDSSAKSHYGAKINNS